MDQRVLTLLNYKQYEQRTPEWYEARKTMITASSVSNLLIRDSVTCDEYIEEYNLQDIFKKDNKCTNPYSTKKQFILDKCGQGTFTGNTATYWGQKYEPVVTDLYSNEFGVKVLEFGLLQHQKHKWLGASPDGITTEGIMIEIKCPFRRRINGIPPFYYWEQVQIQLEVCDLEYCDFVEYEFTEFISQEEWLDDSTIDKPVYSKGLFIQISVVKSTRIPPNPADNKYVYPEKEILCDETQLIKWSEEYLKQLQDENTNPDLSFSIVYWKATDKSIVRIKRSEKWFEGIKDTLKSEWDQVLYYKQGDNYKELLNGGSVKKRKVTPVNKGDTCAFSDEED